MNLKTPLDTLNWINQMIPKKNRKNAEKYIIDIVFD